MINYDEEILKYRSSMEIDGIEEALVKSDLTDMQDILMELLRKETKEQK